MCPRPPPPAPTHPDPRPVQVPPAVPKSPFAALGFTPQEEERARALIQRRSAATRVLHLSSPSAPQPFTHRRSSLPPIHVASLLGHPTAPHRPLPPPTAPTHHPHRPPSRAGSISTATAGPPSPDEVLVALLAGAAGRGEALLQAAAKAGGKDAAMQVCPHVAPE